MSETPGGIYNAICEIMGKIEAIGKDSVNQQQRFRFRSIDAVYNTLHPLLAEFKVFTIPFIEKVDAWDYQTKNGGRMNCVRIEMRYRFCHADGSHFDVKTVGEGADSNDKASNKAMAFAHKYALLQTFCIQTEDEKDGDFENPVDKANRNVAHSRPSTAGANHAPNPVDHKAAQGHPQTEGDLANYICPFGKFKGKTLAEIGIQQLKTDLAYWANSPKKPTGVLLTFLNAASEYVNQSGETIFGDDDVPY